MKKLLLLCLIVWGVSAVASVNQYFRYVGSDGKVMVGLKSGQELYSIGSCSEVDCFLELVNNGGHKIKIEKENFLNETELLTPVPNPKQIIAAAMNFGEHKKETHMKELLLFPKITDLTPWNSKVPHYGKGKDFLDFELELGFLVNRDITKNELKSLEEDGIDLSTLISGVFLTLDMTSRELQVMHGSMFDSSKGFSIAKSLPGYAPSGQFFITYKDFKKSLGNFTMSLAVNKEMRQSSKLEDMVFSPEELLKMAFEKKFRKKEFSSANGEDVKIHQGKIFKGDIILSGTPAGMTFVAPTSKDKMKGFFKGLRKGKNPIKYAKDYILLHQPPHLMPGDIVEASGANLGKISVEISRP